MTTEPLGEVNSVEDLRTQLESQDRDQAIAAVGMLTLMLNKAICSRDKELFHSILREIGTWVETSDGRWMFQTLKKDLSEDDLAWMEELSEGDLAWMNE